MALGKDPLVDPTPDNANEDLFDASIRHQTQLRRFSAFETQRIVELLEKADRELANKLRKRLGKISREPTNFTTKRFKQLRKDIKELRKQVIREARKSVKENVFKLGRNEVTFEEGIFRASIPVDLSFAAVSSQQLSAALFQQPFQGRTLGEWFEGLLRSDQSRILTQLQLGLAQQETIDQIVQRIAGTRKRKFRDGVLATTRREAATIVRTAVNFVSNRAREQFWDNNEDIIAGLRWTAVLDGRTTPICQARDGKFAPVGSKPLPADVEKLIPPTARPPAHPSCRSVMVATLDSDGIAQAMPTRPFVRDTRTGRRRELDFQKAARKTGRPIKELKQEWAAKNIGRLPATITYNDFIKRQPKAFQQQVLGKTRADLVRKGKMDVDQFVDKKGDVITLDELSQDDPTAFVRAGLKPEDF